MSTITSANSKFVINIPDVFPTPQEVQGYAADDAFTQSAFDVTETRMGVDGRLSGGYTPNAKPFTVMLQADSPSIAIFDAWAGAMESDNEAFVASAIIDLPSVHKSYIFTKGFLKNVQKLPSAKKVLEPVPYTIEWESIQVVPLG